MNQPTEYIVEFSGTINDTHRDDRTGARNEPGLVTLINARIKGGWIPIGGISSNFSGHNFIYTQSMVRYPIHS
jgi:hypothetical protein